MSTTDTRAAFEATILDLYPAAKFGRFASGRYNIDWVENQWGGWQLGIAHAEAAKATGTAGELFGYGSSEKKNCLLSKAQYDSCAPKNRTAYDIPLYAHSLPKCEGCKGYGVITHVSGQTPDNYQECNEECPECQGTGEAARQPAPVVAVKTWQERQQEHFAAEMFSMKDDADFMELEIADLRAALAATAAPVLSDEQYKKLEYIAHWMDSSVRYIQNAPDDCGPASQFDYDMGEAAHEILTILAATRSQP